jgi:hypothetical protein
MIKFFFCAFGISAFCAMCLIVGENYVNKHPESKFSRWWRNRVVGEDLENRNYDND